jgi:hypothetical protein
MWALEAELTTIVPQMPPRFLGKSQRLTAVQQQPLCYLGETESMLKLSIEMV